MDEIRFKKKKNKKASSSKASDDNSEEDVMEESDTNLKPKTKLQKDRESLPIYAKREALLEAVRDHQVK